ncbi:hornerin-like isoform X35 [Cuculus canorus]|uniref:hornerin-like isoform X35 n=1 Tax=Cuculus canorus TaxID=55661 RepID=UPI0023AA8833|nr:hornerin-like isoform X35 [Cuculus canorus]
MPMHEHLVDKMRKHSYFVFLFCGLFLPGILGFPQTNSSIDCGSLLPNHEAKPQTTAPPFLIVASFDNFEPGNEIPVTLEGLNGVGFKEFHLQAREIEGDVPVGTFNITDSNTKGLECHNVTNSAVINANSNVKQKVTTKWMAPHGVKDLRFTATVVQDLEKFWVGIQSKTLTPMSSASVNVTGKSKRKLMIALECNKRGGTYTPQGRCIMVGPSSSSQNSYSGSQSGTVYTISTSGCGPGGAAGTYSQHACRDSASSSGLTYGQSVPSSTSDASKKVVVVANSNPFPPVRHTYPQSLGSSATRIIIQSGQRQQSSSSSYVQGSQGSQSFGQGSQPQGGSSYGQDFQPQGGSSYGQGGSSSSGSSGCGQQGYSYDSNPCHQGGSYSSQNYGGSQQSGSSYSQSYGGNQGGLSSSDGYYGGQGSQDSSDDNSNACDDNDTSYSANSLSSGCAKKKVVARDTSHVLSQRDYDVQNDSSTSNSSHTNFQGGSLVATGGGSTQGGCICPDGSTGSRQGAPGSSHSTYSGNQGGPFFIPGGSYGQGSSHSSYSGNQGGSSFYPGGSYGQGAPGSSHSTYSGNQGGPFFIPGGSYGQEGPGSSHSSYSGNQGGSSFYPGGSYGQGGSSAYDSSSESYGQGGSSTYSGAGSYGQDSPPIPSSESDHSGPTSPSGSRQSERDFYSPGGSQSGGHGSSSQGGGYTSGQGSSSSGSSQPSGQGSSSGGSQPGGQGGCDCSGESTSGSPTLVRSDASANDSSSSGASQYGSQDSYSSGASQYGGHGPSSYGGSHYGGQGSPSSGGSQHGGQGSSSSGGSQYGGQGPSFSGGSHYGGGQGFYSGGSQPSGQGGCVCPGGSPGSSYSGSSQYSGQGSSPSGSSQYGGQGSYPSGGRQHGKPGSSFSGGSNQGKPSSSSGSSSSGKPNSPSSGGSQVSSAGKHSSPGLLLLCSILSAFALSAATSKWSI